MPFPCCLSEDLHSKLHDRGPKEASRRGVLALQEGPRDSSQRGGLVRPCPPPPRARGRGPWIHPTKARPLAWTRAAPRTARALLHTDYWKTGTLGAAGAGLGYRHVAFFREGEGSEGHHHRLLGVLKSCGSPRKRSCRRAELCRARRGHVFGNHFPRKGLRKIILMIRLQRNEWTPVATEPRAASVLLFLGRAAPDGRPGALSGVRSAAAAPKLHIMRQKRIL